MSPDEDAEIIYDPSGAERAGDQGTGDGQSGDRRSGAGDVRAALADAERQLMHRQGVHGTGVTRTRDGHDAIVVYVQDEQALSRLPGSVGGFPVIGEVTGEIRAY